MPSSANWAASSESSVRFPPSCRRSATNPGGRPVSATAALTNHPAAHRSSSCGRGGGMATPRPTRYDLQAREAAPPCTSEAGQFAFASRTWNPPSGESIRSRRHRWMRAFDDRRSRSTSEARRRDIASVRRTRASVPWALTTASRARWNASAKRCRRAAHSSRTATGGPMRHDQPRARARSRSTRRSTDRASPTSASARNPRANAPSKPGHAGARSMASEASAAVDRSCILGDMAAEDTRALSVHKCANRPDVRPRRGASAGSASLSRLPRPSSAS